MWVMTSVETPGYFRWFLWNQTGRGVDNQSLTRREVRLIFRSKRDVRGAAAGANRVPVHPAVGADEAKARFQMPKAETKNVRRLKFTSAFNVQPSAIP
jgi:hypothetical protein